MMYNNLANNINEIEDDFEDEIIDPAYDFSTVQLGDENESQAPEVTSELEEKAQNVAENEKTLDDMIDELPDNFPEANPILKSDILPQIIEMDAGMQDYYTVILQKKLSVNKQTIKESIKSFKQEMAPAPIDIEDESPEEEEIDPEILEQAEKLAKDPEVFKKRIDMVNDLGIINERRNIGVISMTLDSRLNPMGVKGSKVLAMKITGMKGSGKTAALMTVKELYSKKCYHYLNSGSAKSIYNMGKNELEHKALILGEAFSFQGTSSNDSEFTHVVRCLVSEGFVTYQYTGFDADGNKVTKYQTINGPTPLITTSIYGRLEEQLDDRMFSIHPDTSANQTNAVLDIEARLASGVIDDVDEKDILVWRTFHDSLEVLDVVIPFATDIQSFLVQGGDLPTSSRRAFNRVLNSIRTISLLHQKQREKDDQGRVIADISDYALAYQLIDSAFRESLGGGKYTDRRIGLIDKLGPVAPRDLAKAEGVSGAAITSWSKNWLGNGVLIWCDDHGVGIKVKDLKKMKHSGKAYLKVVGVNRLPSPFELTGDDRWDLGAELYQFYNLELDSGEDVLSKNIDSLDDFNTLDESETVDLFEDDVVDEGCVKVLRTEFDDDPKETILESCEDPQEIEDDFDSYLNIDLSLPERFLTG